MERDIFLFFSKVFNKYIKGFILKLNGNIKVKIYPPKQRPPSPHNLFDMFSDQKKLKNIDECKDKTIVYAWFI